MLVGFMMKKKFLKIKNILWNKKDIEKTEKREIPDNRFFFSFFFCHQINLRLWAEII